MGVDGPGFVRVDRETGEPLGGLPLPRLRTPKPELRRNAGGKAKALAAKAQGLDGSYLFRFSLYEWGARYGWWVPAADLDERVRRWCLDLRRREGLAVEDEALERRAGRVARYVRECFLPHLSHVVFGRPFYAWKVPGQIALSIGEAEKEVYAMKAQRAVEGARGNEARRRIAEARQGDALRLIGQMLNDPMTVDEMAHYLDVSRRTMQGDLASLRARGLIPAAGAGGRPRR